MFIASIGWTLDFFVSFAGDFCSAPGAAGMSMVIGLAAADGRTSGFIVISGIGDGIMGDGEGPVVMLGIGARGSIVMPGIGAIVAWGDAWAAATMCGANESTMATAIFETARQSNEKRIFPSIYYTT